ncbi:MAG: SMC-Scp complex subunit ScpB [Rhodospirillales bacterium]|nr:SMC-Scp complex subunit ScpB [Alphaproteobacteria bacterium]MCB9987592.1 SMC-Scp complex subunit ScpB [Rhodospirillales bacterium]USO08525.1 MAG: SMC-Scp complex subunit ScpB [Rhodospirillales bacterium]
MHDDETPDEIVAADDDMRDLRTIEAVLFASREPMTLARLQAFVPHLEGPHLHAIIARLRQDYAGRGIQLEETDSGLAFRTAPDLAESLSQLRIEERRLSRAAMECLSVIAYHQPVTRPEIEAVRGVHTSKGTIDALLETGWIKPGRRREAPGRPLTWVTTPEFLDHFGLESIVDLPGLDDLKAAGLLDRRPAVSVTADLFDEDGDRDGEADSEAEESLDETHDAA